LDIKEISKEDMATKVIESVLESERPEGLTQRQLKVACDKAYEMLTGGILIVMFMEDKVNLKYDFRKRNLRFYARLTDKNQAKQS
jgi:hypothetical protein